LWIICNGSFPYIINSDFYPSLISSSIDDNTESKFSFQSCNERYNLWTSIVDISNEENIKSIFKIKTNENDREDTKAKSFFKIEFSHKKRGRKSTEKIKKKIPNSLRYDNIASKIQTHFLSFLISFLNDCVASFSFDQKIFFLKFRYKEKSKSSSKYFKKLKNSSIEELIESMNISDKYKKFEKDKNRSSLKELSKNDWFVKLFKLKYLDLFSSYYNNEQPLKKLSFFGKTISFSETTKSFYDLLVKNEKSKEDIINAAKIFFFDDKGDFESD